jgi:hypothetical protein
MAPLAGVSHAVAKPTALLVEDTLPWGCDGGTGADQSALAAEAVVYNTVTSAQFLSMNVAQLQSYRMIIFAGNQFASTYSALGNPTVRIEIGALLGKGVNIIIHAVDKGGCGNAFWGGSFVFPVYMSVQHVLDYDGTDHVVGIGGVVTGVSSPITGTDASHDYFTNLPAGSKVLIENSIDQPVYFTYTLGKGTLFASTMTLEFFGNGGPDGGAFGPAYTTILLNEVQLANYGYLV